MASWLDRYKSWLKREEEVKRKADPTFNRIYLQLFQAQREHYFIDMQIAEDDATYQSMILELDPNEKTLLIDELFPTGFQGLPGQKLTVAIRQPKGRKLRFETEILEQHYHDDVPIYVLAMPETELYADQRRGAFRLNVDSVASIYPHFVGPDEQSYHALLKNVSSSGLGLEVTVGDPRRFHFNDRLKQVAFDFAGTTIGCDMAIRNVSSPASEWHLEDKPDKSTLHIGAEFIGLPAQEQRLLERSIMRIQRDRIRMGEDTGRRPVGNAGCHSFKNY